MSEPATAFSQPGAAFNPTFPLSNTLPKAQDIPRGSLRRPRVSDSELDAVNNFMPTAILSRSENSRSVFLPLQEWEGVVTRILDDSFTALMADLSDRERGLQDEAEFPLSDVESDANPLLKVGSIFRWSVGYVVVDGTRHRSSRVVFRRLPGWTKRDIEAGKTYARELGKAITWD